MKKIKVKILSMLLIIITLLNVILPVVYSAPIQYQPNYFVSESDIDKSNEYMTLELKSDSTSKTAGDTIIVSVYLKSTYAGLNNILEFQACAYYDSAKLELKNIINVDGGNSSKSNIGADRNPENVDGGNGPLIYILFESTTKPGPSAGEKIFDLEFEIKENITTPVEILLMNIDCSIDDESHGFSDYDYKVNTPNIFVPKEEETPVIQKHGIEITKVDEEENIITSSNAIFKITTPDGNNILEETNNGVILCEDLNLPTGNTNNIYEYIIEERVAPDGYIVDNTAKTLNIEFNIDGTIKNALIDGVVQTVENNIVKLKFENKKEKEEDIIPESKINFVINKKDEKGNLITTSPASFGLEISSDDIRYLSTTNGTVSKIVNVPEDTSLPYTYKLKETNAPEGYLLDNSDIEFRVVFEKNSDKTVSVKSVTKVSGENATIIGSGNIIRIDVVNEKIKEQEKFQIEISKVDENTNVITSDTTKFILTAPNGTSQIGETNITNGKVIIQGNIPEGEMNPDGYTYTIQEVKQPTGYTLDSSIKSVNLIFADTADGRKLSSANVIGTNITKGTITNNILPINIVNQKEQGNFTITLNKVDNEQNPIRMANTSFKMTAPDGNVTLLQTDAQGVAIYNGQLPSEQGTKNYKIQEIVPPTGYILNESEISIGLNFEKPASDVLLSSVTVSDPLSQVGTITNNNVTLNFKNILNTPPATQAEKFDFIVTKIDSSNGQTIAKTGTIFQLLNNDGTVVGLFETNANGVATIKVDMPDIATTKTYKLIEKVAPEGYELNSTPVDVEVIFVDNGGVISIQNINVNSDNVRKGSITSTSASVSFENTPKQAPELPKTFDLIINKKDSISLASITQADILFKITAPDGTTNYLGTDASGKITISNNMPTVAGTYEYKIEEIVPPTGYTLYGTEQSISIVIDSNFQITNASSVSGAKIQKDFAGVNTSGNNEIEVSILNDKEVEEVEEKFTLKIAKVDENQVNIAQENIYFKVEDINKNIMLIQTDVTGVAKFVGTIPNEAGSYQYKIKELVAPVGYVKNDNEITINLIFSEVEGKIKLSNISVNEAQEVRKVGEVTDNTATVAVINKQIIEEEFILNINKQDKDSKTNINKSDVVFEIVKPDGSEYISTNSAGVATFVGKMPSVTGSVNYKIKELVAPSGYIKNPNEMSLRIDFVENSGVIEVSSVGMDETKGIRQLGTINNNVINVAVDNEKGEEEEPDPEKKEKFTLNINKQDKDSQVNINEKDIVFEVILPDGKNAYVATNVTGIATFEGIIPNEEGTLNYKIKELVAPSGYIKNPNEMNVTITFVENGGKIEVFNITVDETKGIRKLGLINNNIINVAVDNEKEQVPVEPIEEEFTLNINKQDKDLKTNITEAGVVFHVKSPNGENSYISTNTVGVATFQGKIPSIAGTLTYKVKELVAPSGYIKNPNEMEIGITFVENSGKIEVSNITIDETKGIRKIGTISNNVINVAVDNEKEKEEEPDEKDAKFTLEIQKADKETTANINEEDVIFKLTDVSGKYDFYGTDVNGRVVAEFDMPKSAGTYTYYIQETVAPTGYEKNPNRIAVEITFVEDNERLEIQKVYVDEKNQIIFSEEARKENTLSWCYAGLVKVLDEKIEEEKPDTFTLELNKIDSENLKAILQEGVILKVKAPDGTSSYLATDVNGKIKLNYVMPNMPGTLRYEIEEIKAPTGYKLCEEVQYLDITFDEVDGIMQITNATVSGSKIQMTYGTNQVIVNILNDHNEIVVDPEKETFDIIINKMDTDTLKNILQEGVTFRIQDFNKSNSYIETNSEGQGKITLNIPQTEGKHRYTLLEVIEPTGYVRNLKNLYIDVTFMKLEEKIELIDVVVNESNGITVLGMEEGEIQIGIFNDKIKENPDTPDNPNNPDTPDTPDNPDNPNDFRDDFKVEVNKYLTKITENYSNTGMKKVTQVPRTNKMNKLDIKASQYKYANIELELIQVK